MKSMCHDARRNSPSVVDWRPISSCFATMRRIASSSIAQLVGVDLPGGRVVPRLQELGRTEEAADVVGAERRCVRRPVRVAVAVSECISGTSCVARAEAISPATVRVHASRVVADAVVYQIYVRSFADSDGDGVGDLNGIRSRLVYLQRARRRRLLADAVLPVARRRPRLRRRGLHRRRPAVRTLADFDALVEEAHALGLRVLVDIVLNHTSREHPWFRTRLGRPSRPRAPVLRPGATEARRTAGRPCSAAGVDARRAERRVVPPLLLARPARPRLAQRAGAGPTSRTSCASGSTAASTAFASTSRRRSSRCRTSTRWSSPTRRRGTRTGSRPSTSRSCTRSTGAGGRSRTSIPESGCSSARSYCRIRSISRATSSRTGCTSPSRSRSSTPSGTRRAARDEIEPRDRRSTRSARRRRGSSRTTTSRDSRPATAARARPRGRAAPARAARREVPLPGSEPGSRRSSCLTTRGRIRSSSAPGERVGRHCRVPPPWRTARRGQATRDPVAPDAGRVARELTVERSVSATTRRSSSTGARWRAAVGRARLAREPAGDVVFERGSLVCAVNVDGGAPRAPGRGRRRHRTPVEAGSRPCRRWTPPPGSYSSVDRHRTKEQHDVDPVRRDPAAGRRRADRAIRHLVRHVWTDFAALMMGIVGVWNILSGSSPSATRTSTTTTRGSSSATSTRGAGSRSRWARCLLSAIGVLRGSQAGRLVGVGVVSLNAIHQLAEVSYQPVWGSCCSPSTCSSSTRSSSTAVPRAVRRVRCSVEASDGQGGALDPGVSSRAVTSQSQLAPRQRLPVAGSTQRSGRDDAPQPHAVLAAAALEQAEREAGGERVAGADLVDDLDVRCARPSARRPRARRPSSVAATSSTPKSARPSSRPQRYQSTYGRTSACAAAASAASPRAPAGNSGRT